MANQVYGYASSYGGAGLPTAYSSMLGGGGSAADPYLSNPSLIGSSRYLSSDPLSGSDPSKFYDSFRFSGNGDIGGYSGGFAASRMPGGVGAAAPSYPQSSWPGVDALPAAALEPAVPGVKRSAEG